MSESHAAGPDDFVFINASEGEKIMKPRLQDIEWAKKVLPFVQGVAEGKPIQIIERDIDRSVIGWVDCSSVAWDRLEDHRIKPDPVWRPWKLTEAPAVFMVKHKPGNQSNFPQICRRVGVGFILQVSEGKERAITTDELLQFYFHVKEQDGSFGPCGVMEIPK